MTWKQRIARSFRFFGYDLVRYQPNRHPLARIIRLLEEHRIGMVLDVGANRGQYAAEIRANGYKGRIVSFEPLQSACMELKATAAADPMWEIRRLALGATPGRARLNIAGNSTSSSLLEMLPMHEAAAPASKYIGDEEVEVSTIDRILPTVGDPGGAIWLKIDTQGYEGEVLKGAEISLPRIRCIQLEMSLVPLYDGADSFESLFAGLNSRGYRLIGLEPGFTDNQSGRLLQVDGIFHLE